MMESIYFTAKTLIITFVIVLLMQIRWDEKTIEYHTLKFITTSSMTKPIESTASGAVTFLRNSWVSVTRSLNTNFSNAMRSENQPGSRKLISESMGRSKEYVKQTTKKTKAEATEIKENASSIVAKFKNKISHVSDRVRTQFSNDKEDRGETQRDGREDASKARSTNDDDMIEE